MTTRAARDVRLEEREAHEVASFTRTVREGRSVSADRDLILSSHSVRRLLEAGDGAIDPLEQMLAWVRPLEGARILEICCHDGEFGAILAAGGADVAAVDLCPELVAQARRRIALNRLGGRMTAQVMSVHALDFPDDQFDFVFGKASLHHLDLDASRREIRRVLKPGGVGIFAEPVLLSRALGAVRRRVPVAIDRESPDERQLNEQDLVRFAEGFVDVERAYFRVTSRIDRVLPWFHRPLARLDRALLTGFPAARRFAGTCVLRVRKPACPVGLPSALEPWV